MITVIPRLRVAVPALVALLLVTGTGCTGRPASPTRSSSHTKSVGTSASPQPTSTADGRPVRLSVPAVTADELSRVVYSGAPSSMRSEIRREARAGRQYSLDAACLSDPVGKVITVTLSSSKPGSGTGVTSGSVTCDGDVTGISTPLPAAAVQVGFGSDLTGVTSAYAILKSSP